MSDFSKQKRKPLAETCVSSVQIFTVKSFIFAEGQHKHKLKTCTVKTH